MNKERFKMTVENTDTKKESHQAWCQMHIDELKAKRNEQNANEIDEIIDKWKYYQEHGRP